MQSHDKHITDMSVISKPLALVDKADVVVCTYDGQSEGTAYTANYAMKKGKIVIQIKPSTEEVTIISKHTFLK